MDPRLHQNVEPQIREDDNWDKMVQLAERYDATMYKTGAYKGKGGGQNTSNRTETPKKQFNNDVTNRIPVKGKGKGKAPANRKTTTKNQKPSKAEMDRRKAEGACFYCGEKGHRANECPKKEVKTNHVRLISAKKRVFPCASCRSVLRSGQITSNPIDVFKIPLV